MARNQGIAVSTSRFALLKIEDDEDNERPQSKNSNQANANAARKKNKKKKEQKENEQLKQLAFGGKNSGKKKNQPQSNGGGKGGGDQKNPDWDQWKEHDKEFTEEQFKDDLAVALLASRIETEQKEQERKMKKERIEAGIEPPQTREERKKKKQKEKPQAMSLDQFKQLPKERVPNSDDESDGEMNGSEPAAMQTRVPATQQDPKFFTTVNDDAEQILRQEKMQEEYRKHYASDNVIVAKLTNDLEKKDIKIQELQEKMNTMEAELKGVKKRNKQLCFILAQGEMKDKAQVLLQVDELTNMRDELTEQVTSLTADLEKEKSKNRALKSEVDKIKSNKGSK